MISDGHSSHFLQQGQEGHSGGDEGMRRREHALLRVRLLEIHTTEVSTSEKIPPSEGQEFAL